MKKILITTFLLLCTPPLLAMNTTFDIDIFTQWIITEPNELDELKEFENLLTEYTQSNNNVDDFIYNRDFKKYNPLGLAHTYHNWTAAYVLTETGSNPSTIKDIVAKNHIQACYSDLSWTTQELLEQALYAKKIIREQKPFFKLIDILNKKIKACSLRNFNTIQSSNDIQRHFEAKLDIYAMTLITALGNSILDYTKTLPSYYARIQCNYDFLSDVEQLLNLELTNGTYHSRNDKISIKKDYENFKRALQETMPQLMSWKIAQKYNNEF